MQQIRKKRWLTLLLVLVMYVPLSSSAECKKENKSQYIHGTSLFVKGLVEDLKRDGDKISFKIRVIKTFKRRIAEDVLIVKYNLKEAKPSAHQYKNGRIYVFGIEELDDDEAKIHYDSCYPRLKDRDLVLNGYDPNDQGRRKIKKWNGVTGTPD